jgi:transposase InsO family protein
MAWKGKCPVGERRQMIELVRSGVPVVEAAEMFGVTRKTAHKWLRRAEAQGLGGLADRSRARHHVERFEGPAADAVVRLRRKHPTWGPRKLLQVLGRQQPELSLPAASTAGDLLKRAGLVSPRARRGTPGVPPYRLTETQPQRPNDRWTVDFKGEFRLLNGALCWPLTLRDAVSRKLLDIFGMPSTSGTTVLKRYERAFREYGLPLELHSDLGQPFSSHGLARLSWLSVYLLKLGIRPIFSRPGKPQDNGGHERMHRDLKAETVFPPAADPRAQQRRFDDFRTCFNEERPHDALKGRTPDSVWRPSSRSYPSKLKEPKYLPHWETRRVTENGQMIWKGEGIYVTSALAHETVGLEPVEDGVWRVHFAMLALGYFDERSIRRKVLGPQLYSATDLTPTEATT